MSGRISIGIDVGSATVQVALVHERSSGQFDVIGDLEERIRRRVPERVARHAFENVVQQAGIKASDIAYIASTGDDEAVPFRDGHFYGMTTHARGALYLAPEVNGALDIGALHARAIVFDRGGRVGNYRMTGQCASGSGQFLENISRYLGVTLDEVGPLSLQAKAPETPSGICAVLAETDVINLVSRGVSTPDILKGLHISIGNRLMRLLKAVQLEGPVLATGGGARDVGLIRALEELLAKGADRAGPVPIEIRRHPRAPLAGAIGAGIWGLVRYDRLASKADMGGGYEARA